MTGLAKLCEAGGSSGGKDVGPEGGEMRLA
jgi:hypothetical protein